MSASVSVTAPAPQQQVTAPIPPSFLSIQSHAKSKPKVVAKPTQKEKEKVTSDSDSETESESESDEKSKSKTKSQSQTSTQNRTLKQTTEQEQEFDYRPYDYIHPQHKLSYEELQPLKPTENEPAMYRSLLIDGYGGSGMDFIYRMFGTPLAIPPMIHFTTLSDVHVTLSDANPTFVVGDALFGGSEETVRRVFASRVTAQPTVDSEGFVHYQNSIGGHGELNVNNCAVLGWFVKSVNVHSKFAVGVRCGHKVDTKVGYAEMARIRQASSHRPHPMVVAPLHSVTGTSIGVPSATDVPRTFVRYEPTVSSVSSSVFVRRKAETNEKNADTITKMGGTYEYKPGCAMTETFTHVFLPDSRVGETPLRIGSAHPERLSSVLAVQVDASQLQNITELTVVAKDQFRMAAAAERETVAAPTKAFSYATYEFQPMAVTALPVYVVKPHTDLARWKRTSVAETTLMVVFATSVLDLVRQYEDLQKFLETDETGLAMTVLNPTVAAQLRERPFRITPTVRSLTHMELQVLTAQEYDVPVSHSILAFVDNQNSRATTTEGVVTVPFMDMQAAFSKMRRQSREQELVSSSRSLPRLCVQAQPTDPTNLVSSWRLDLCLSVLWAPLSANGPDPWVKSSAPQTHSPLVGTFFKESQLMRLMFT